MFNFEWQASVADPNDAKTECARVPGDCQKRPSSTNRRVAPAEFQRAFIFLSHRIAYLLRSDEAFMACSRDRSGRQL